MNDLEHKYYLAEVERSAMAGLNLPKLPRGLLGILLMVGLTAILGVAWV